MSKMYYSKYFDSCCIVAENRKLRPQIEDEKESCPFCVGNEHYIDNIWMEEKDDKSNFLIRIINNKYPICDRENPLYGIHDVVIDTPNHLENPKDFSYEHWYKLLRCIKKRCEAILSDERINFVQVFKNFGTKAGASIKHSHWQIVALTQVPESMMQHYQMFDAYSDGDCFMCDWLKTLSKDYVAFENELWVCVSPQAPMFSHETWIIPKGHKKSFIMLKDKELWNLGCLFKDILSAYEKVIPDMHYNLCFMSALDKRDLGYHFFIKIVPRNSQIAGFEIATGCHVNTVDSITHAYTLREALIEDGRS